MHLDHPHFKHFWLGMSLVTLSGLWGYSHYDEYAHRIELAEDAKLVMVHMASSYPAWPQEDLLYHVTVSRQYLLFGESTGKVTMFVRRETPDHKYLYWAFDQYYSHENDAWKLVDTGACAHGSGAQRSNEAFTLYEGKADTFTHTAAMVTGVNQLFTL